MEVRSRPRAIAVATLVDHHDAVPAGIANERVDVGVAVAARPDVDRVTGVVGPSEVMATRARGDDVAVLMSERRELPPGRGATVGGLEFVVRDRFEVRHD